MARIFISIHMDAKGTFNNVAVEGNDISKIIKAVRELEKEFMPHLSSSLSITIASPSDEEKK